MKWEYKRILFPGNLAIENFHLRSEKKRYRHDGSLKDLNIPDPVEDFLNELGNDGWELVATTIVDGAQNSHKCKETCVIEYIFKRIKETHKRRSTMKKNLSIITVMFAALVLTAAGPASAAKIKAHVKTAATNHEEVCAGITQLEGKDANACAVNEDVTSITILEAGKKLSMKEGQDVILKAKGTGKVMAKVATIIPAGEESTALDKTENGAVVIKGDKGCIAVIVPEKPFAPEKDAKVTIKTKHRPAVEGC